MNNDAEFESRSKQHTLQRWDNHLQPDCGLEGPVPVQRRLLGAVDEDNDDNTSLPPPRLPQRRLLYHESMDQGAESSQSSAKLPDDNASNRATASKKPTKTAGDDETVRSGPMVSYLSLNILIKCPPFAGIQIELYSRFD